MLVAIEYRLECVRNESFATEFRDEVHVQRSDLESELAGASARPTIGSGATVLDEALRCPETRALQFTCRPIVPSRFRVVALWLVDRVPVVAEVPVRCQEPGLEIGQAVCRCLAQHPGWILK